MNWSIRVLMGFFILCLFQAAAAWSPEAELRLEFAQEGEPTKTRALFLIHDALQGRESLAPFLSTWSDRDRGWARNQYCSVYSYEYRSRGVRDLPESDVLAADLYDRIRRDKFIPAHPDEVNPRPKPVPENELQSAPQLAQKELEILIVGYGYGGLVARRLSQLAERDGLKVVGVACVGSPLDGLSTTELLLSFSIAERALALGLSHPLKSEEFFGLSSGWRSLVEIFEAPEPMAPSEGVRWLAYSGTSRLPNHPTDNVLYGARRRAADFRASGDGWCPQIATWGRLTGPIVWSASKESTSLHKELTSGSVEFLIAHLPDRETIDDYLWRRQQIEEFVRGDGEMEPLYIYWDERDNKHVLPQWREAYASRKGLYEMMWL